MTTNMRWFIFLVFFLLAMMEGFMYAIGAFGQGAGFLGVIFMIAGAAFLCGPGESE